MPTKNESMRIMNTLTMSRSAARHSFW